MGPNISTLCSPIELAISGEIKSAMAFEALPPPKKSRTPATAATAVAIKL